VPIIAVGWDKTTTNRHRPTLPVASRSATSAKMRLSLALALAPRARSTMRDARAEPTQLYRSGRQPCYDLSQRIHHPPGPLTGVSARLSRQESVHFFRRTVALGTSDPEVRRFNPHCDASSPTSLPRVAIYCKNGYPARWWSKLNPAAVSCA
jgi:hypothetical protein